MLAFFVCVVLIILETNAENHSPDNPDIIINNSPPCSNRINSYTVVKNKPLKIILKTDSVRKVFGLHCAAYSYWDRKYRYNMDSTGPDEIITIHNITDEMSKQWLCFVETYGKPQNEYYLCPVSFKLHVKGAGKVSFTVNGWSLEPDVSDQPNTKLDGEKLYEYFDGQLIILTCDTAGKGTKLLKYYDAQGSLLFKTDEMFPAPLFRSVLTARHNNFYIVCEFNDRYSYVTYYYRLTFVLSKRVSKNDDQISLFVNGIKLAPTDLHNIGYYNYYYEYGFQSTLNVTYQNNNNNESCDFQNKDQSSVLEDTTKPSNIRQIILSTKNLSDITWINCKYINMHTVKLNLMSGVWRRTATRIFGLPEKNIEYQYTKNRSFYSMSYRYSANEAVQLICFTDYASAKKFVWNYENKSTTIYVPENTYFPKKAKLNFTILAEYNATSIQCDVWDAYEKKVHTVDVFLNLDPTSKVSTSLITDENKPLIIGGSLAVTGVILTVISAFCWCTRTRKKIIENNYENSSNNSTIPANPRERENAYDYASQVNSPGEQSEPPSEPRYNNSTIPANPREWENAYDYASQVNSPGEQSEPPSEPRYNNSTIPANPREWENAYDYASQVNSPGEQSEPPSEPRYNNSTIPANPREWKNAYDYASQVNSPGEQSEPPSEPHYYTEIDYTKCRLAS